MPTPLPGLVPAGGPSSGGEWRPPVREPDSTAETPVEKRVASGTRSAPGPRCGWNIPTARIAFARPARRVGGEPYAPRRPEGTVLYGLVREHLETFLAHAREHYERPLPRYVEKELRGYLKCGIFSYGFVRCHCDACGHDMLVAFSCKNRGICPSCSARRMCSSAAHLVDRVLPNVPVRQWVLSLPFELRRFAAFRAEVLTAIARIFYETVSSDYQRRMGLRGAATGAVTCVQRFGGSINLNPHLHVAFLDGVFKFDGGDARFTSAAPPTQVELAQVARRVHERVLRWLGRKGLLDGRLREERPDLPAEVEPLDAFAEASLRGGTFAALTDAPRLDDAREAQMNRRPGRFAAEHGGFNLHAGVRIGEGDDEGRERLLRYMLRPCLALDRLSVVRDGLIAYRVKAPRGPRATHRVMTPVEFLARVSALIPPPQVSAGSVPRCAGPQVTPSCFGDSAAQGACASSRVSSPAGRADAVRSPVGASDDSRPERRDSGARAEWISGRRRRIRRRARGRQDHCGFLDASDRRRESRLVRATRRGRRSARRTS